MGRCDDLINPFEVSRPSRCFDLTLREVKMAVQYYRHAWVPQLLLSIDQCLLLCTTHRSKLLCLLFVVLLASCETDVLSI